MSFRKGFKEFRKTYRYGRKTGASRRQSLRVGWRMGRKFR